MSTPIPKVMCPKCRKVFVAIVTNGTLRVPRHSLHGSILSDKTVLPSCGGSGAAIAAAKGTVQG